MAKKDDSAARKFDLEVVGSAKDLGELQYNVLIAVSEKRYEDAVSNLQKYRDRRREAVYVKKTSTIFKHSEDLIHAIEAKKNFPNLSALAQSKQEEIHSKALENWESLKVALRRLRTIETDLAVADARSSIWVIKAILFSFIVILSTWVVNETVKSFGKSFPQFMDETARLIMDWFNSLLG